MARPAKNQLNTTNAVAANAGNNAANASSSLLPFYTSELGPGLTPSEQATESLGEQGITGSFGGAANEATENAARTRNDAGTSASLDQLALEKGQALGDLNLGTQAGVQRRQQSGAQGLEQMYGTDINQENSMYGLGPSTLDALSSESDPAWLNSLIGGAGVAAGGYLGGLGKK